MTLTGNYTTTFLNQSTPDVMGFMLAIPKELLGAELLYAWFIFLTLSMVYLKSRTSGMVAIVGLIIGGVALSQLPAASQGIGVLLVTIAAGAVLYRVFKS